MSFVLHPRQSWHEGARVPELLSTGSALQSGHKKHIRTPNIEGINTRMQNK